MTVSASVTGTDQPTEGEYMIVDRVEVSDGGASDKEGSGDEAPWFGTVLTPVALIAVARRHTRDQVSSRTIRRQSEPIIYISRMVQL